MLPPRAAVAATSCQPPVLFCVISMKPALPVFSEMVFAASRISSHVAGGLSGSSPASSNSVRL
jgi:hypothetical protein